VKVKSISEEEREAAAIGALSSRVSAIFCAGENVQSVGHLPH
jgi:hypothetical protein